MDPKRQTPIHLALQGGGAHGALTWGVLDRLLEDGDFEIRAVSGTSAGAINAIVLAGGYARNGPSGAREALSRFWGAVGAAAKLSPMRPGLWERLAGHWSLEGSPGYHLYENLTRIAAPNALNPLGLDPLREIVAGLVDFDLVARGPIVVHVAATDVRTGLPRVFSGPEVGIDAVMASACLPQMNRAVEIDGVPYWDGGFSANPALLPLAEDESSRDIVLVQLNPALREAPEGARGISSRVSEMAFNAPLLGELRALAWADARSPLGLRLHRIYADEVADMATSSRFIADWGHLQLLFARGQEWAGDWLEADAEAVGVRSSFDPATLLVQSPAEAEPRPPRFSWRRMREALTRLVGRISPPMNS